MAQGSVNPLEKRPWLGAALIVLFGVLAYSNTLQTPLIFDDHNSITDNPHIRSLWPLSKALSAPPQATVAGRPVVSLTLAVNHAISGLEPWSYHVFNLLIHLGSGLLLWTLVRRTASSPRAPSALAEAPQLWAFAIAAVWTVHPLTTESVTYVSTRTESLAGLLILATITLASRGFESPNPVRWYAAATATSFLAMGSKETAVALPLLVLCYDRVFAGGSFRTVLSDRRGLYAGLAASWILLAVLVAGGHRSETVGYGLGDITAIDYLRTQVGAIFHYLRLVVWPHPLCLDYADWTIVRSTTPAIVGGGLILLSLLTMSLHATGKGKWHGFLGLWFFLLLGPSSSLVPIISEIVAERRMYLPLVSVVVFLLAGLWRLTGSTVRRHHRSVFAAGCTVIIIGLAIATGARNAAYESAESIWRDTLEARPDNARAHSNLGRILAIRGERAEAEKHLRRAIELDPDAVEARDNLATLLLETGASEDAAQLLEDAVDLRPEDATTRIHLGNTLLDGGDAKAALEHFEAAARLRPDDAVAHSRMGSALAALGRLDEALAAQQRAVELDPNHVLIRIDLGKLLMRRGDPESAAREFRIALELQPDNADTLFLSANALVWIGRESEAEAHLRSALVHRPGWGSAGNALARLLATAADPEVRNPQEAVQLAEGLCRASQYGHPVLLETLVLAYSAAGRNEEARETAIRGEAVARQAGAQDIADRLAGYRE